MEGYVQNVARIDKGLQKLKRIEAMVEKGVAGIAKKDLKKMFRNEELDREMVLIQMEMGFMQGLMKRYKGIFDEKIKFLDRWQYFSNDFSVFKAVGG